MVAEDEIENETASPKSEAQEDPLPTSHPKLEAFQSAVTQVLLRRIAETEVKIGQLRKEKEVKAREREERTKVTVSYAFQIVPFFLEFLCKSFTLEHLARRCTRPRRSFRRRKSR